MHGHAFPFVRVTTLRFSKVMELRNILFVSVLLVIAVMACVGNLIVILSVFSHRRLQNPANYLIVNLAFADLLRGAISMPMRLVESLNTSKENLIRCDVVISFTILFYGASNANLLLIALDRFVAISKPLSYQNIVKASNYKIAIVITWIVILIFSLCPVFGWCKQDSLSGSAGSVCRFNTTLTQEYHILFVVFIVAIPLAIMLVTYTYIFRTTRKQIKQIRAQEIAVTNAAINLAFEHQKNTHEDCESCSHAAEEEAAKTTPPPGTEPECDKKETSLANNNVLDDPSKHQSETLKREVSVTTMEVKASTRKVPLSTVQTRKATRTVLAIIGFFFVLCIPIAILDVIEFWCDSCGEIPKWVSTVALCMVYANSCVNVFVYGGYNTEYRTAYRNVWVNTKKVFCRPFLLITKLKNNVAAESPTDFA